MRGKVCPVALQAQFAGNEATPRSPELASCGSLDAGLCFTSVPAVDYTVATAFIGIISLGPINPLERDFWVKGDGHFYTSLSRATFAKAVFRDADFLEKCFQGQLVFSLKI